MKIEIKEPYRELNAEESHYRDKLIWALTSTDVPPEIAEIVENGILAQCIEQRFKKRYYKPYWFVTNTGFVLSVCDKGRNSGSPVSLISPYLCGKYHYVDNKNGTGRDILHHVLVALYHDPEANKYLSLYGKEVEVHHIRPFDKTLPYWFNNNIQNLQMLPRNNYNGFTGHQTLHAIKTLDAFKISKINKVRASSQPIIVLTDSSGNRVTFTVPIGKTPHEYALTKGIELT